MKNRKNNQKKRNTKQLNQKTTKMKVTQNNQKLFNQIIDSKEKIFLSFDELKKISDENFGRFNRSIDVEEIEMFIPNVKNNKFRLSFQIEHHHFMGEITEKHFRFLVEHPQFSDRLTQDISIEQLEKIVESNTIINRN